MLGNAKNSKSEYLVWVQVNRKVSWEYVGLNLNFKLRLSVLPGGIVSRSTMTHTGAIGNYNTGQREPQRRKSASTWLSDKF